MPINPAQTYLHFTADGAITPVPGGDAFWSLPPAELARYGEGWVATEFEFAEDWPHWEVHPAGDEFVYLLQGSIELLLDMPEGVQCVPLKGPGVVVVPRGIWHTARVHEPSRALHVTRGAGTEHRPFEEARGAS